jgi:hypothetical protein
MSCCVRGLVWLRHRIALAAQGGGRNTVACCRGMRACEGGRDWSRLGEANVGAGAGGDLPTDKPAGHGRGECTAANVEGGGRMSPSNVATWSEKH